MFTAAWAVYTPCVCSTYACVDSCGLPVARPVSPRHAPRQETFEVNCGS